MDSQIINLVVTKGDLTVKGRDIGIIKQNTIRFLSFIKEVEEFVSNETKDRFDKAFIR